MTGSLLRDRGSTRRKLLASIQSFVTEMPYKADPYRKRNWGHPLHSLCSYQGKLKPAIAHWLIRNFTTAESTVLDPLGGVGTIGFEACALGRFGITNDLSPLAYAVGTGKVCIPPSPEIETALSTFAKTLATIQLDNSDRRAAEFGLNGQVADYYHHDTLDEVLRARKYFLELEHPRASDLFVKACLLHVLHGNRPYALSRTSHPITPFHPSGPATYKSVVKHVRDRAAGVLRVPLPDEFRRGTSFHGDFRQLPDKMSAVDRIITSPPFWGMRFDRPNWLRMWFCGWTDEDFLETSRGFLEREQKESLSVYEDFFAVCQNLLIPGGLLIVHLGGSDKHDMVATLVGLARQTFEVVGVVTEDVSEAERHGIKDKGLTTTHNYLFLQGCA